MSLSTRHWATPLLRCWPTTAWACAALVEHLHQLGHRRIAYANARATYLSHYSVTERYEALLNWPASSKIELARGHNTPFCSAPEFLRDTVLRDKATAIITYDHHIAVTLVGAAHAMNIRIPDDVSLVCFNDVFPVALMPPPLTAVSVSGREMGRIGAGLLLNSLGQSKRAVAPTEVRVPEELIVRRSTAPACPPGAKARTTFRVPEESLREVLLRPRKMELRLATRLDLGSLVQPQRGGDHPWIPAAPLRDPVDKLIRAGPIAAAVGLPFDMCAIGPFEESSHLRIAIKLEHLPRNMHEEGDLAHPRVGRGG